MERLSDPPDDAIMRQHGVRSLACRVLDLSPRAIKSAEPWLNDVPVPTFGPRMVCTPCGIIGADARPNWREHRPRAQGDAVRSSAFGRASFAQ
jgi:hypothetical protein